MILRPSLSLRASVAPARSRFSAPILPLDYFLNRSKSLALYRAFIRASKGLGDAQARREAVAWIRSDFERYKDVVDSDKFKTLHAMAHRELKIFNSNGMLVGTNGDKWRGSRVTKQR